MGKRWWYNVNAGHGRPVVKEVDADTVLMWLAAPPEQDEISVVHLAPNLVQYEDYRGSHLFVAAPWESNAYCIFEGIEKEYEEV